MKKRHLMLATLSALGLMALSWAGGPTGTIVRVGPLEWSFAAASEPIVGVSEPVSPDSEPLVRVEAPREPIS